MIASELAALLEPLERYEVIRRRAARLGPRLADLSYANPYEARHEPARAAIRAALDDERLLDLQYAPFGGQTLARRAVAEALTHAYALPFEYQDVVLTPGAMAALQLALRAVGAEAREVVMPVPCWLDYPLYARFQGLTPRMVPFAGERFELDLEAVAAALGPRTCAVLLSHPANPTGRNYSPEQLAALAETLRAAEQRFDNQITLIADETHRDYTPENQHSSLAAWFDRTLIVYSFGKYHLIQGQRLGYLAVSPRHPEREEVAEELVRWTRITGMATPTALMQRALPRLLELRHDLSWIEESRARFVQTLTGYGYEVVEPDSTMFIYVKTPGAWSDDFAFVEYLAGRGVLVLPAPVFHHEGYFRLALTASVGGLERALGAIGNAVVAA